MTCTEGHRFPDGSTEKHFTCEGDGSWMPIHDCECKHDVVDQENHTVCDYYFSDVEKNLVFMVKVKDTITAII